MVLRAEVDFVEAAGARSPATVYPPPDRGWEDLDEPTRAAVTTITASMQVRPGAHRGPRRRQTRRPGRRHRRRPRQEQARPGDAGHRHRDRLRRHPPLRRTRTDPTATRARLDNGEWTIPPGNLLVIDDADHLDPKQLRYFTEHAARTNTKLLLVHTPTGPAPPPTPSSTPWPTTCPGPNTSAPPPRPRDRPGPHRHPPRRAPTRHHRRPRRRRTPRPPRHPATTYREQHTPGRTPHPRHHPPPRPRTLKRGRGASAYTSRLSCPN